MKSAEPRTLVLATRNRHKAGEIQAILGGHMQYATLDDFPAAPDVVEDARTFAGNATKKAVALARWLGPHLASHNSKPETRNQELETALWVLADDSGLEVDGLGGAPGVHSARFAALDRAVAGNAPDGDNNSKLLRLLKDLPFEMRTARFRCVLALAPVLPPTPENASPVCYADEVEIQTQLFEGICEGRIGFEPRGTGGFGYDPLFYPLGADQTFAELGEEVKNRLSHRAKALLKLKAALSRLA